MKFWYTLAHSNIGTHKMKFKGPMTKSNAENMGITYCLDNNLEYIGTYDGHQINTAEADFRVDNY